MISRAPGLTGGSAWVAPHYNSQPPPLGRPKVNRRNITMTNDVTETNKPSVIETGVKEANGVIEPSLIEPRRNKPGLNKTVVNPSLILRVVISLYLIWSGVVVGDLVLCRLSSNSGSIDPANRGCDAQVGEVKGVFTTITVGLMGWVSDSPMR